MALLQEKTNISMEQNREFRNGPTRLIDFQLLKPFNTVKKYFFRKGTGATICCHYVHIYTHTYTYIRNTYLNMCVKNKEF